MTIKNTLGALAMLAMAAGPALAQAQYGPGASDTEIRIGNTMPYSGPASVFAVNGRMIAAVIARANAEGGINGRQINFISYDDAYNPARTMEQTRRLVERDEVLFIAAPVGSAHNIAIQRYLNQREVPHLLLLAGGTRWNDPQTYPWTVSGLLSPYGLEGYAFAQNAVAENPTASIAVLYQNDDLGREYLQGVERGIEGTGATIASALSFEVVDPSVDGQIVSLQATGADTLMLFGVPRAVAQAIRKAADLGWTPARYMGSVASVIQTSLVPAGVEISTGIITSATQQDASDEAFQQTQAYRDYMDTIEGYYPDAEPTNGSVISGYNTGHVLLQILREAGDTLTRQNILDVARNLSTVDAPLMLPGIPLATSPDNYQMIRGIQLERFNGQSYDLFGDVVEF